MCLRICQCAYFHVSVFLNVSVRSYLSVQSEKPQAAQRKTRVKPSCQGNLSNFPQLPCCICIQASKYSPKTFLLYLYPSFRNISTNILAEFESKHQNPVSSHMLYLYSSSNFHFSIFLAVFVDKMPNHYLNLSLLYFYACLRRMSFIFQSYFGVSSLLFLSLK